MKGQLNNPKFFGFGLIVIGLYVVISQGNSNGWLLAALGLLFLIAR